MHYSIPYFVLEDKFKSYVNSAHMSFYTQVESYLERNNLPTEELSCPPIFSSPSVAPEESPLVVESFYLEGYFQSVKAYYERLPEVVRRIAMDTNLPYPERAITGILNGTREDCPVFIPLDSLKELIRNRLMHLRKLLSYKAEVEMLCLLEDPLAMQAAIGVIAQRHFSETVPQD